MISLIKSIATENLHKYYLSRTYYFVFTYILSALFFMLIFIVIDILKPDICGKETFSKVEQDIARDILWKSLLNSEVIDSSNLGYVINFMRLKLCHLLQ